MSRKKVNEEIVLWGKKYIKEKKKNPFLIANLRDYMYEKKALRDIPCSGKISRALTQSNCFKIEHRGNKPSLYHFREDKI